MKSYAHNNGTFIGKGGIEIFFQSWCVENPKGLLVIAHGVGEHSGRYNNIINELDGRGISIYALDHRGHGKSGGKRGHVESFMDYCYDLKLFIDLIKEENSDIPLILLGHSMGGVIACKYALTYAEDLDGLVLSSAGFMLAVEAPGWKKKLGNFFSKYIPSFSMSSGLDAKDISHDVDVVEAYENDRMVHDQVSARWFTEFISSGEDCLNRALEIRMPLLVFCGKDDRIVDYHGSESLFNNASSLDKELHIFEDMYHETMNEIEYKKVLRVVARWILSKINIKKKSKVTNKNTIKKPIKKIARKNVSSGAKKIKKKAPVKKGVKK